MKLKNMSKEEIELMSLTDITYQLLKENKKAMTTPEIFKTICELLEYSDEEYATKIGDYYTSLTIDKRFVLLEDGKWDVRDNHSVEILVDDEDEEDEIEEVEEEFTAEEDIDDVDSIDDDNDLDVDDDLDELAIIKDEDMDEENE